MASLLSLKQNLAKEIVKIGESLNELHQVLGSSFILSSAIEDRVTFIKTNFQAPLISKRLETEVQTLEELLIDLRRTLVHHSSADSSDNILKSKVSFLSFVVEATANHFLLCCRYFEEFRHQSCSLQHITKRDIVFVGPADTTIYSTIVETRRGISTLNRDIRAYITQVTII